MHYFVIISEIIEVKEKPESLSGNDSGRLGKASTVLPASKLNWYQNKSISVDFECPYSLVDMQKRLNIYFCTFIKVSVTVRGVGMFMRLFEKSYKV